jgi:hypothetical protein
MLLKAVFYLLFGFSDVDMNKEVFFLGKFFEPGERFFGYGIDSMRS